jgi:uncharacterized protein (DUF2147 family)
VKQSGFRPFGAGIKWLVAAAALILAGGSSASTSAPIEGTWLMDRGAELMVTPCGDAYCGVMNWIVIPKEHSAACMADKETFAAQMLDYKNPDQSLKTRSLIGMVMMTVKPTKNPNRYDVQLYSVEDGKVYDGAAEVAGDHLNLQQCLGICVTVRSWPRIPTRTGPPGFSCG